MATKADLEKENNELKQNLITLQEQMQTLMEQMQSFSVDKQAVSTNAETDILRKKVDVVCLLDCRATLSTGLHGSGVVYQFNGYGSTRKIRFGDLERIVNVTKQVAFDVGVEKSFFENGSFYIADADVVEELGLGEAYETILDKSKIDSMVQLKDEFAVNIFKGANKNVKDTVASMIIDKYNSGINYDRNLLKEISDIYGKDIIEIANNKKATDKK